jgi:hypothetical protein
MLIQVILARRTVINALPSVIGVTSSTVTLPSPSFGNPTTYFSDRFLSVSFQPGDRDDEKSSRNRSNTDERSAAGYGGRGEPSSVSRAETGQVAVIVTKGGFIVGVGGGEGVLTLRGKHYPFAVSGMSVGFTIGASTT